MSAAAKAASPGRHDRRKAVESALAGFVRRPAARRVAPPDGRLGPDDYPIHRLRLALAALGPVFADFGRYLSTRRDLLSRRDCAELALIPDAGLPAHAAAAEALVDRQLGPRRFFQFDSHARHVTLWTERHDAWVAPGVPAVVTIVRPDAAEWLDRDLPLLCLLQDCLGLEREACAAAADDFTHTLRIRLDQTLQAASLSALAADAASVGGFDAPGCYRDYCAPGVLTLEPCDGPTLAEILECGGPQADEGAGLARRIALAWLQQALASHLVPFEFGARDIVVTDERLVLTGAACEPHNTAQRARFSRYVNAVAADDPDAAAAWIVDAAGAPAPPAVLEEELKRRFRQAVPFRDGEWSGDDRLVEYLLVQWRVAREAGWRLTPHHLHVYRGIGTVARLAEALAPEEDTLLAALQDARLRHGVGETAGFVNPNAMRARLDTALREMVSLPQKLDDVLTMAAEGRLRVKLQLPESGDARRVKHQTVLLVASLVLVVAIASLVRHVAPTSGPAVERIGVVVMLVAGGWLLVAAARL